MSKITGLFLGSVVVVVIISAVMSGMPGGLTVDRDGDETSQAVANAVRGKVHEKLGGSNSVVEYTVEKYRTQVVAGTNFFLKIRIAPNKYVHARVYRNLKGETELHSVQLDKQQGDQLEYF